MDEEESEGGRVSDDPQHLGASGDIIGALSDRVSELTKRVATLESELDAARKRVTVYEEFDATVRDALAGALRAAHQIRARAENAAQQILEQAREERKMLLKEIERLREERDGLVDEIASTRRSGFSALRGPRREAAAERPVEETAADARQQAAEALRGVFTELLEDIRRQAGAAADAAREANAAAAQARAAQEEARRASEAQRQAEAERATEAARAAELARRANEEAARAAEEARRAADAQREAQVAADAARAAETQRAAEAARQAEAAMRAAQDAQRKVDAERSAAEAERTAARAEEARRLEEGRRLEEERRAQQWRDEADRRSAERRAEEERIAESTRAAEAAARAAQDAARAAEAARAAQAIPRLEEEELFQAPPATFAESPATPAEPPATFAEASAAPDLFVVERERTETVAEPEQVTPEREEPAAPSSNIVLMLSPVPSFARLVDIERRIQALAQIRTLYVRDFRGGTATLALGLRVPMSVDELWAAMAALEQPRLAMLRSGGNTLELRIEGEAGVA